MIRVVIIGGGISGLAAAYYLEQGAARAGRDVDCVVVEADAQLGGKIQTRRRDGFVVEGAPDSFLTQKPWGLDLARELGLEDHLVGIASTESARILVRGKLRPIPSGVALLVPTRLRPFLDSAILTPAGKLRVLREALVPPRRSDADESLASFVRRRLGPEMLDVFGEPLLAGIYAADPERLSLRATFPRFLDVERRSGSLLRDAWKTNRVVGRPRPTPPPSKPRSPFLSFQNGMAELVEALAARLRATVLVGRRAVSVRPADSGQSNGSRRYDLTLDNGTTLRADAVVLATPSYAAAELLNESHPDLAARLRSIRFVSTATVSLGYRRADVPGPLKSSGFVIARSEGRRITACTWSSSKFPGRAPDDRVLLRGFVGNAHDESALALDDAALVALVQMELRELMGIHAAPVLADVFRWPRAMPQYDVGHLDRVAALEAALPPGLHLVGNAYHGIGIPDLVHGAQETARRLVEEIEDRGPLAVS